MGKRKIDFTKNRIQIGNCELEYFAERIRCPPPPHFHEFLVERNNCQAASINRQREFIFSLISSVRSDQLMRGPRTCYECPHTLAASNYYSNALSPQLENSYVVRFSTTNAITISRKYIIFHVTRKKKNPDDVSTTNNKKDIPS